jgi:hypothetical protein
MIYWRQASKRSEERDRTKEVVMRTSTMPAPSFPARRWWFIALTMGLLLLTFTAFAASRVTPGAHAPHTLPDAVTAAELVELKQARIQAHSSAAPAVSQSNR